MLKLRVIKGKIILLSGLHIGGSEQGMQIGGIDNAVIRNMVTGLPYIPGSSLKGKMRFLLEHFYNLVDKKDNGAIPKFWKDGVHSVSKIFGLMPDTKNEIEKTGQKLPADLYPTRVIFRDTQIIGAYLDFQEKKPNEFKDIEQFKENFNNLFSEEKTEVAIDRLTGTAKDKALRTIERVPAGSVFEFEIVLRQFLAEDKDDLTIIKEGLKLLENDSIGGSGSRGSGRFRFMDLTCNGEQFDLQGINLAPKDN